MKSLHRNSREIHYNAERYHDFVTLLELRAKYRCLVNLYHALSYMRGTLPLLVEVEKTTTKRNWDEQITSSIFIANI